MPPRLMMPAGGLYHWWKVAHQHIDEAQAQLYGEATGAKADAGRSRSYDCIIAHLQQPLTAGCVHMYAGLVACSKGHS